MAPDVPDASGSPDAPDETATGSGVQASRWLGQGVWAVTDQGFSSAANFLINILLARALDVTAYGAFAVAYQIFWLLVMVHASTIGEPMLALASGRFAERREEYLRTLMLGQVGVAMLASAVAAAAAGVLWLTGQETMALSLAGLALATPPLLTLISLRRVAISRLETRSAALGGAANLALLAVGLVCLHALGRIGIFSAFAVLAGAAGVVCVLLWRACRLGNPLARPRPLMREVAQQHVRYGRWGVAAGALAWVPGNLYYVLLPLLPGAAFGLSMTASLRALVNLIMPALQANAALGSAAIPVLSARRRRRQRSPVLPLAAALVGASVLYALGLVLFGERLVDWLYGGRYQATPLLLLLLGLIPVLTAATHLLRGVTLAHDRPDLLFWANLAAAIGAVAGGLPLVLWLGLPGVLLAMALGPALSALVILVRNPARESATRGS